MIPIALPLIGVEEEKAVNEVLKSGILAQGPRVKGFEDAFAAYTETGHAVSASSGTTALHLALLASGIKQGDEVITTPFSFIATANAILYCGAKPVFSDIDERTFNLNPDGISERITSKTKALLAVHLYGQPCDMDPIRKICADHDLRLIEDACQAHGAKYRGTKVGALGDCGVFSFYPTKNMTTGEGGMITTDDPLISDRARLLREHGSTVRYHHEVLGYNYRMTDIAAAIGIAQLNKLDGFNDKRMKNARSLTQAVQRVKGLTPPYTMADVSHVYHQYTIRVKEDFHLSRDEVAKRLSEKGIGTGIYYPLPIHKQPVYKGKYRDLKVSERASEEVLSLPVHPGLSEKDLDHISRSLRQI